MSDVTRYQPIPSTPWGHINGALDPESSDVPTGQPAEPIEYQSFNDWGTENASGDELTDLKGYTNYVRTSYLDAGEDKFSIDVENQLRTELYTAAVQRGLVDEGEDGFRSLFTTPEYNPEAGIKTLAEVGKSAVTAMAANDPDALPEGVAPEQVWDDIITYSAKKKAYDREIAVNPEFAEKNPEFAKDLAFWKERAEGYADSAMFDKAAIHALHDGKAPAVRIYNEEDGSSYVRLGKSARGMSVPQIIANSKDYGITPEDALDIAHQSSVPDGFKDSTADLMLYEDVRSGLEELITKPVGEGGDDLGQKQFKRVIDLYAAFDSSKADGDTADQVRLNRLIDDEVTALYVTAGRVDPLIANADMDLDEFKKVVEHQATGQLMESGGFKLQDDPDKLQHNLKRYGYGPAKIHSAIAYSKPEFDKVVAANPDLNDTEIKMLEAQREASAAANADNAIELLSDGPNSKEFLDHYQAGLADNKKKHEIVSEWVSDEDNFSEFKTRLAGVGQAWGQGIVSMVTAPLAMMDVEWARDHLIGVQANNADRRQRARMFGTEFGIGQDVMETIGPVFADMAATAALTTATGAGGVAFLAAKQGAKLTAKGMTSGIMRSMALRPVFKQVTKQGVQETPKEALERLIKKGYIKETTDKGTRKGAMESIEQFGKIVSSEAVTTPAVLLPAFNRSAGSTYAAVYDTLTQSNPDMSHEDRHDRALGAGLMAGVATAALVKGFQAIGRGGIEDAFIKGMTKQESLQVVSRLAGQRGIINEKIWAKAVNKTQADLFNGAGKFSGRRICLWR